MVSYGKSFKILVQTRSFVTKSYTAVW